MQNTSNWGSAVRRIGFVIMSAAVLAACQDDAPDPVAQAEAALRADPRPAKIFTVSEEAGFLWRRFTGRVEAVKTVDMSFQVPGKLEALPVLESQHVAEGDLVAKLDPADFERAVREATLRVNRAKRDLERIETLKDRAVISQKSYDDQKNEYDLAVEALERAEQDLEYTALHAPFDGIASVRLVDNYTTVGVGTPVLRLQDISEIQIDINVPEALFAKVAENQIVSMHADFPSLPGQEFPLEYREHSSQVDQVTQTYRITLAMPRDENMRIYPGMTAAVVVKVKPDGLPLGDAVMVPTSAVSVDADKNAFVWKFDDASGEVAKKPVQIGTVSGEYLPVTSGLEIGDEIVSAGVAYLSDGQTVRPLR
ncbi:efflux RND transporter periplasmic adaptor subunit [Roseibium sp. RKSG952]|uniref:efflux RND transporter periplasmic adaptor subunit n=1 Tax=Roseibium sp. RKSG952 TaxID=2529384 RepID=UPI0012BB737E|nr:efflux RND transporter periplasmic adaptor subunit [Roseibium sp. RKSG952]MTH97228.1 efflux RND transporter periplasmic adaptor subunit [Roseibium sp. RKSG952]